MNEQVAAITALVGALVGLGGLGMAAWKFARPSAEFTLDGSAQFQQRLMQDNQDLWTRIRAIQADLQQCEVGRRDLEQTVRNLTSRMESLERRDAEP